MSKRDHCRIIFAHSELQLPGNGPEGAPGLAAGYLSARPLNPAERATWLTVFADRWAQACDLLALRLVQDSVDAFTMTPCSRKDVSHGVRCALARHGLRQLPDLLVKTSASVAYSGKPFEYIRAHTTVLRADLGDAKRIAVCDDFAESGRTLAGLCKLLEKSFETSSKHWIAASVGVSAAVALQQEAN